MIKKLFNKFIENLNKETEFDESRRRVVKGVAGLAALAAISPSLVVDGKQFVDFSSSDFERMCASGVIENMTFYLDRTTKLEGMNGLTIRNCKFIALEGFEGESMFYLGDCSNCVITDCHLDVGNIANTAMTFGGLPC
ncbi:pectin lyase fold/virulence factor [Vibrio phage 1.021.C._10N.222.51.F9]|nr:pectin lyase fold/virulence factor [Vibrio phage 1.021.A._10N.222.51.F9]AUR82160.1 pectin lyase fold/virulence factor [Vibrio phage 1.021.B._10N.222.51.F9]AUR82210.1 pectin lyase fold/virulence factor [Vibrio phage 1.021.C._10N.222.51.F9]